MTLFFYFATFYKQNISELIEFSEIIDNILENLD